MSAKKSRTALNSALVKTTAEANEIFAAMCSEVERRVEAGETELNVVEIAGIAGLQIDERIIDELRIDRIIIVKPWLPIHIWWPWRPLWCWWWHRYHPWYRCCPWWWYRCRWWPWSNFSG